MLLPAVRAASRDTLIMADGFSCREQIARSTGRRALPLAEVRRMTIRQGPNGPAGDLPERGSVIDHSREQLDRRELAGAGLTAAGLILADAGARAALRRR